MELSIDELEIIKASLEGDIIRQKKFLDELEENGGSDIRFSIWLDETYKLHKKISLGLFNKKAEKGTMNHELHFYLRNIRIKHKELLKDMADKLGMSPSELSSIEHGKTPVPEGFMDKIEALYNQ